MDSFLDKILNGSEAILQPLHVPLFTAGGSQIDTFDILEFCLVFLVAYWLGKLSEESIKKFGSRHNSVRPESLSMFARFIHWGILAIGILMGDYRSPDHTFGNLSFRLICGHRLRIADHR